MLRIPTSRSPTCSTGRINMQASADTLHSALAVAPNNPMISAQLGRSYAQLGRSSEAMQAIDSAERTGGKDYKVLLVTADALRILGRRDQAMTTYARALESSDEDRLQVRLALGRLFAEEGQSSRRAATSGARLCRGESRAYRCDLG